MGNLPVWNGFNYTVEGPARGAFAKEKSKAPRPKSRFSDLSFANRVQ